MYGDGALPKEGAVVGTDAEGALTCFGEEHGEGEAARFAGREGGAEECAVVGQFKDGVGALGLAADEFERRGEGRGGRVGEREGDGNVASGRESLRGQGYIHAYLRAGAGKGVGQERVGDAVGVEEEHLLIAEEALGNVGRAAVGGGIGEEELVEGVPVLVVVAAVAPVDVVETVVADAVDDEGMAVDVAGVAGI